MLTLLRFQVGETLMRIGLVLAASCRRVLPAVLILMFAAGALMAQTGGGATLVGTVKDSGGAVVAGAKVTVVNIATSFTTEVTSSEDGAYYVPYLTPGDYRINFN